jgi:hypothetical protein
MINYHMSGNRVAYVNVFFIVVVDSHTIDFFVCKALYATLLNRVEDVGNAVVNVLLGIVVLSVESLIA